MKEKHIQGMKARESSTLYNTKEITVIRKPTLTDQRRKVGFAAVFMDIIRRGTLPEEASIHIAEITALREIQKREDMRWAIYTERTIQR